jgi:phosphatidylglycerophosphate synthase
VRPAQAASRPVRGKGCQNTGFRARPSVPHVRWVPVPGPANPARPIRKCHPRHMDEDGWAALHGGLRPSRAARAWLGLVQRLAATAPLTRASPDALSVAGVAVAGGAVVAALPGGRWALLTALLVIVSGVLDGLDGAVALRTGRARPLGAVVDATCDRIGDLLLVGVLAVAGAPLPWCAAVGAAVLMHEYVRARAQVAGMSGVGAVTVTERPTRVIVVAVVSLGAGILPSGTPWTGWAWAAVGVAVWAVLSAVGLVQLAVGVIRAVPAQAGPIIPATMPADSTTSGSPPPGWVEPPTR